MKDKTPLVSVILPVFNAEKYLPDAISSIINQTYNNLEIIILNDGSTDGSAKIISDFKRQDKRIIVFHYENCGLVKTLNKGFELAKGKYIARMDADDISVLNRIEKQVSKMGGNTKFVLCGTWFQEMGNSNKKHRVFCRDEDIRLRSLFSPQFCHPSVLIQSDVAKRIKFKDEFFMAEDYMYWLQLMEVGKVCNIPETLIKYRVHESQISIEKRSKQKKVHLKVAKKNWEIIAKILIPEEVLEPILFGANDKDSLNDSLSFIQSIENIKIQKLALSHLWKMNKKKLFSLKILVFMRGGIEAVLEKYRERT